MPAWGQVIGEEGVANVAAYVRAELAGLPLPEGTQADLAAGKAVFAQNCVACHGAAGEGMAMLGAPKLTNPAGWIYGSTSLGQLQQTIRHGRNGQMPAQQQYLGNDKVHLLAATFTACHKNRNNSPASESQGAVHSDRPLDLVPAQVFLPCDVLSQALQLTALPPFHAHVLSFADWSADHRATARKCRRSAHRSGAKTTL